jgi:diacylglycerol kinase (ATP)
VLECDTNAPQKRAHVGSGMRTKVIVNPMAAKGRMGHRWRWYRARLEAVLGPLNVSFTLRPGDATRWARAAARYGCERFVVLGGDGSVNEVLNGLLSSGIDGLTLWPLPSGTGNDSCRGLGVPLDPADAIDTLGGTRTRAVDVMRIDLHDLNGMPRTRYGLILVSFGAPAAISRNASASRWMKRLGRIAYYLATPPVVLSYGARATRISIDDAPAAERALFGGMIAGLPYGGGGMKLVPPARPDDGQLDLVELGRLGRFQALFQVMPRLYDGGHLAHPSVSLRQGMRSIRLESAAETLVDVDGETIGRLPATVTVLPGAIRVPDFS